MMDELVSRREAIKVVRASCHWDYPWASKSPKDIMSDAVNALKELPSAQPEIKTDGDTISRQMAIDAVEESRRLNPHKDGKEACCHEYEHRHFLAILHDLPPAQPEHKTGRWMHSDNKLVPYYCSLCSGRFDYEWKFCPNCGAEMLKAEN